jgi:hypothetical protein
MISPRLFGARGFSAGHVASFLFSARGLAFTR